MEFLTNLVDQINNILWSEYVLVPLLVFSAIYFTIRTRFVQIRLFPVMIKLVFSNSKSSGNKVSSVEAFAVGLASRVGTGNIAGVALAIISGGPGSVFWMWIIAIFGAANSFVESTLAQLYKVKDRNTGYRGGPAYYIRDGIGNKVVSKIFAFLIVLSLGIFVNMVQINTISNAAIKIFGFENHRLFFTALIGFIVVILTVMIIIGGTKKIADFTSRFVPFMACIYIGMALLVVILQYREIPAVISLILSDAFTGQAMAGGVVGTTIIFGIKRGLFSNEAGMGSAPNAAASADTDHPVKQGLIQSLGVYIDTLVICSATAFIILSSNTTLDPTATDGISVTMNALASVVGNWANYFILIAVFLFGFSTILGFYFYSVSNIEFLTTKSGAIKVFQITLLASIMFGAISNSELIWGLGDIGFALLAIVNLFSILRLGNQVLILLKDFEGQLKSNEDPQFDSSQYPEFSHISVWKKK